MHQILSHLSKKLTAIVLLSSLIITPFTFAFDDELDGFDNSDSDSQSFFSADDLKNPQGQFNPLDSQEYDPNNPLTLDPETFYRAGVVSEKEIPLKYEGCPKGQDDCVRLNAQMMDLVVSGYSLPGEPVEALVSKDIEWQKKVLIPKGSKLTGVVTESELAEKLNDKTTNSILGMQFDRLWFPNQPEPTGVKLTWRKEESKSVRIQHQVGNGIMGGIGGAIKGAIKGLSIGGVYTAVNTYGATLIAPGAVGAVKGAAKKVRETDFSIVLEEGEQVSFWINPESLSQVSNKEKYAASTVQLPTVAQNPQSSNVTQYAKQISLAVSGVKLENDPFDVKNQLTVDFSLDNPLPIGFSSLNIAVVDSFGKRYYLSPFADNKGYLVKFPPLQSRQQQLTFSINNPNLNYQLVLFNPDKPGDIVAKVNIPKLN